MASAPDVTVVGAGPVGMTVAALLGDAGHRVRVVERRRAPTDAPRAVHLDHHAARVLDAAGVMTALAPATEVMDVYEWRSASGEVLLRLQPDGPLGWAGWPDSSMFHHPDLEAALARRLDGLATVTVERGTEVTSLAGLDGWVVGADGASSTVRDLAGTEMPDAAPSADWLIVDVVPAEPRPWTPCNVQVCDPARPTTAVSGGPGRRRFEFMVLPGEDPAHLATEASTWALLEPWGYRPGNCRVERHALYRFAARMVETWADGRVLLAGDAAHQMPPFAGRGLGAGLRDAMNLAWKLDLVLRSVADGRLLDTYGTERAAPVAFETQFSADLGAI
ncbi:MAG TPA: bifunctional 3-(3-hydroxy-phenyl)propionate/3-hydroxycinnamic acid hydroxylase, partial [Acidimicrobiales bacterium]|nr:bifunctional 3-(3-hydroxy-phenyl)propionate/3-hydroxycinnamic acid hydroxylase [Acidimicrobiales bacterium]